MTRRAHKVAIRIGASVIEKWTDYRIRLDMLSPADGFAVSLAGAGVEAWRLCEPDADVQVLLDDVAVVTGFLDDRRRRVEGGSTLQATGRDKGGRLVDESMPLLAFDGLGIQQLAEKVAAPWFPKITLSNATNRRLLRGTGAHLARVTREPPIDVSPRAKKKVEPGETRWQVLAAFLEEAELLAWSSADGKEFIVGLPNYEQELQYRFFLPRPGSARAREGNVLSLEVLDSVGERYSQITAVGSGRGNAATYGDQVTKRNATVKNGPGLDGIGTDFLHPKRLIVSDDDVRSLDLAAKRARREMAERDGTGHTIKLTVAGHGQVGSGPTPTLYAFDTMALVEDEEISLKGPYLVTAVEFTVDRQGGEITELDLVPKGTVLKL